MKTIGLIGGTTWYSTIDYYKYINLYTNENLGGDQSARIIINSINYGEIITLTREDRWGEISKIICQAAKQLEQAGADCVLIGANTMHHVASDVSAAINIPLIHIATETAKEIRKLDIDTVALLGTKYTMELAFFRDILQEHGIKTILPAADSMEKINTAIYEELGKGVILDPTKKMFLEIIDKLAGLGADGVILGCTEIPLLIKPADSPLPVFDTTAIHAKAAVNFALRL